MAKIINIANQKGGVGKTTTAINIAVGLSLWEKRTLLIDFDPQANATTGLGIDKSRIKNNIYNMLVNDEFEKDQVIDLNYNNYLFLIPSNEDLSVFPMDVADLPERTHLLKDFVDKIEGDFDYIIIDSPPSLNLTSINALIASTDLIIPVQAEFFALEGLSQLIKTINKVENMIKRKINILGYLVTMFSSRTSISNQVLDEVKKHFCDLVFNTVIPRSVRMAEAPGFGESVLTFAPSSKGAFAYKDLIVEIMERANGGKKD